MTLRAALSLSQGKVDLPNVIFVLSGEHKQTIRIGWRQNLVTVGHAAEFC